MLFRVGIDIANLAWCGTPPLRNDEKNPFSLLFYPITVCSPCCIMHMTKRKCAQDARPKRVRLESDEKMLSNMAETACLAQAMRGRRGVVCCPWY